MCAVSVGHASATPGRRTRFAGKPRDSYEGFHAHGLKLDGHPSLFKSRSHFFFFFSYLTFPPAWPIQMAWIRIRIPLPALAGSAS